MFQKSDYENIYQVEFNKYTNGLRNTVWRKETNEYLDINDSILLIRESQLYHYSKFGDGFKQLTCVGKMLIITKEYGYAQLLHEQELAEDE